MILEEINFITLLEDRCREKTLEIFLKWKGKACMQWFLFQCNVLTFNINNKCSRKNKEKRFLKGYCHHHNILNYCTCYEIVRMTGTLYDFTFKIIQSGQCSFIQLNKNNLWKVKSSIQLVRERTTIQTKL